MFIALFYGILRIKSFVDRGFGIERDITWCSEFYIIGDLMRFIGHLRLVPSHWGT